MSGVMAANIFALSSQEYIWTYIKIEKGVLNYSNFSQYFSFYCIFNQINAALCEPWKEASLIKILDLPYFWPEVYMVTLNHCFDQSKLMCQISPT